MHKVSCLNKQSTVSALFTTSVLKSKLPAKLFNLGEHFYMYSGTYNLGKK